LADNTPCGLLVRMSLDAHPDSKLGLHGARESNVAGSARSKMALPGE
jgi:hypothetical protein